MDVYDPVEDHLSGAEIDFETFLLISAARRDYFLSVQKCQPSAHTRDRTTLPPTDLEVRGIIMAAAHYAQSARQAARRTAA